MFPLSERSFFFFFCCGLFCFSYCLLQSTKDNIVQEKGFFGGPYSKGVSLVVDLSLIIFFFFCFEEWMAPESIQLNIFSKKTDVFMFGVTLWEIMSRSLPYPDLGSVFSCFPVCFSFDAPRHLHGGRSGGARRTASPSRSSLAPQVAGAAHRNLAD